MSYDLVDEYSTEGTKAAQKFTAGADYLCADHVRFPQHCQLQVHVLSPLPSRVCASSWRFVSIYYMISYV